MRSFNSVHGDGFKQICQVLIDIGYKYGLMETIKPPTNISRTIKPIANEYRLKMNEILRQELKQEKLISISTDYWKISNTADNYLTINIHYTKDNNPVIYMLKIILFSGTKSGENSARAIKIILKSYDIDPEETYIIYLTDNASNFISGSQASKRLVKLLVFFLVRR
ncbi:unnamed protein product [Rotaria socialis]|uniref:Transposase n=1 Tax=Rotaria socialis TaxID=392032 RepID=A0A818HL30_9BILA|nr:unnamed protein product [Rotaria socialis]CAF4799485.1 unnamed protein product [Rotaria socialis]